MFSNRDYPIKTHDNPQNSEDQEVYITTSAHGTTQTEISQPAFELIVIAHSRCLIGYIDMSHSTNVSKHAFVLSGVANATLRYDKSSLNKNVEEIKAINRC